MRVLYLSQTLVFLVMNDHVGYVLLTLLRAKMAVKSSKMRTTKDVGHEIYLYSTGVITTTNMVNAYDSIDRGTGRVTKPSGCGWEAYDEAEDNP